MSEDVLLARAYLSRVGEPADVAVWILVRDEGPVEAARTVRAGRGPAAVRAATETRRSTADPHGDLDAAQRRGIRLVVPESDEWPHFAFAALERTGARRAAIYDAGDKRRDETGEPMPPLALWVAGPGDLPSLGIRSAGIVGSRSATDYGGQVTAELAYGLARSQVVIVSGGAYGIDAAAHRAALAADGITVVVSAGGLDRPYPPSSAGLFERAAVNGLLVSESPPGCAPQRRRFLIRNRLIAALSTGVVVVEAAARSGAMNTAHHAVRLGRPLMAVPGPVTSAVSVGCHEMLRREQDPALMVTCADEVLAVVGGIGEGTVPGERRDDAAGSDVRAELDRLDATARQVFDGLSARRFARPDEVAQRSGTTPTDVVRALPALDLAGLIEASEAGYRIAARLRAKAP